MKANRASATARLIAAATVMREEQRAHGDAAPVGAAAWCRRFLSTTRTDRLLLWTVRSGLGRAGWKLVEAVTLPGIVSHWMRRKREIDRLARDAAAEGFTQLVVLGAGLDSLPFRLSQEKLFDCVLSADHPATLAVIRAAVNSEPCGVGLLSLDLTHQDARSVLTASRAFDPARATVFVIEGVLMYLSQPVVERLLLSLAGLSSSQMRLIASWMIAEPATPIGFRGQSPMIISWLKRQGESMLWASTPAALPTMLCKLGWNDARLIDLTANTGGNSPDNRGLPSEQLVVTDKAQMN